MSLPKGDGTAGFKDALTGSPEPPRPGAGAARVRAVSGPDLRSLLAVVVGAIVIAGLYFGRGVLIPITLAVLLSFVLSPVVNLLQRLRIGRAPAVILAVLLALGAIGLLGTLIGEQAASLATGAPQYARTLELKAESAEDYAARRMAGVSRALSAKLPTRRQTSPPFILQQPQHGAAAPRRPVLVEIAQAAPTPFQFVRTILQPIVSPLETAAIVLIVAVFILMQKEDLRDRFIRLFGSNDLHRTTVAMDDAGRRLSRYFLSQLAVNTSFGIVIGSGLWLIGVPSPAMWGVLAGLLRFVPYVGSSLAALAPIALGAAVDPGWAVALEVAALFVVVEPLVGYVVEPLLYGHSTGLSPVSVVVAAIFWTWLWGPIGLILSTPLTLCLVVTGRHVKSLEFFDVAFGDRPALSPIESFYQRILADNPDEALAHAEVILKDTPLGDYYDAVVLKCLKLAADDEGRGLVTRERALEMANAILSVVDELADRAIPDEEEARVAAAPARIACVAGGGVFDDTVAAMLAQLLAQLGQHARVIVHASVTRDAIARLDLSGVSVIAVSLLEVHGSPAPLRYLIRRLRARAPGARIVAGFWPDGEAVLTDPAIQAALGAEAYVRTLAEAADAILTDLSARDAA